MSNKYLHDHVIVRAYLTGHQRTAIARSMYLSVAHVNFIIDYTLLNLSKPEQDRYHFKRLTEHLAMPMTYAHFWLETLDRDEEYRGVISKGFVLPEAGGPELFGKTARNLNMVRAYLKGRTYEEIAALVGVTSTTVNSAVKQTLRRIEHSDRRYSDSTPPEGIHAKPRQHADFWFGLIKKYEEDHGLDTTHYRLGD